MAHENGMGINRATGLLVIEVRNSNPNGDPDQESDPRQRRHDERGLISPVSFKRKLRDLVDNKEGPLWSAVKESLGLDDAAFDILEARHHKRGELGDLLRTNLESFRRRFWDGRLFGNTFLEEGGGDTQRSGVAHFGLGVSIAPVRIERLTLTKMAPAQEGKEGADSPTRGMAPLGYRVVEHGVYCMPFFINPTAATKTGCSKADIDLLLALIPHAYPHTASFVRPFVEIRHAWYAEHKSRLGSCSDFAIIDWLTPTKKGDREEPSTGWDDYEVKRELGQLSDKVADFRDLMEVA
jgi:CRISPR-associated protein Csd2